MVQIFPSNRSHYISLLARLPLKNFDFAFAELSRHRLFFHPDDVVWIAPAYSQCRLKTAYEFSMKLTDIYNQKIPVSVARLKLARWFNELEQFDPIRFTTVIETFITHNDTIINYFNKRLTNASAEFFNAKIKELRRQFRGINDTAFFLFRLNALYG